VRERRRRYERAGTTGHPDDIADERTGVAEQPDIYFLEEVDKVPA
jgi:hypothetical protein